MKAAPAQQRRMLDLADLDAELARTRHRLANLPEADEVVRIEGELAATRGDVSTAQAAVTEMQARYDQIDAELTGMTQHAERDRAQLESGALSHKALSELQHELSGLQRRQELLENDLLEVMERQEALGMELDHSRGAVAGLEAALAEAVTARDHATAAGENQVTDFLDRRTAIAGEVPADLLAAYDRLRTQGQVGAGLLRQRRCGACRMELDPRTLASIAAADEDEVLRCEECNALLIRTEQSGLVQPGPRQ